MKKFLPLFVAAFLLVNMFYLGEAGLSHLIYSNSNFINFDLLSKYKIWF